MKKGIRNGLIGILILIVVGFVVLTFTIDHIVKSGIEDIGTEMAGTEVSVSGVSLSLFSGTGIISGFQVTNPDGYSRDVAIKVDEITIKIDIASLFSDLLIVRDLRVRAPSILVEQQLPENNIRDIMSHIRDTERVEDSDSDMVIEYFLLEGGVVDLFTEVGSKRSAQVEISTIELEDLGRGGGRQAVEGVIKEIAERVGDEILKAAAESGGEQIRDAIRDLFD